MSKRTFIAVVDGETIEIPTTMNVLNAAQELSEVSLMEAIAENKLGPIIQGVIAVVRHNMLDRPVPKTELKLQQQRESDKALYREIGDLCDFAETRDNTLAFMQAMMPEVKKSSKNARAGESKRSALPGDTSSDTPTDSSN